MAAHALTTPVPSLRASLAERTATLRASLARISRPSAARADLLLAYAEAQDVRPIFEEDILSTSRRYRSALAVDQRLRGLLQGILNAPAPMTREGLATVALAAAIHAEGGLQGLLLDNAAELAATARALLTATGTTLPLSFLGFGDEPDFLRREADLLARPGHLPAWA